LKRLVRPRTSIIGVSFGVGFSSISKRALIFPKTA
jgi:hypothetical protein